MDEAPLLVYDGDCSFCSSSARWITGHWNGPQQAVAWQHLSLDQLERLGLTLDDARGAAWWIDPSRGRSRGHLAIARALRAAPGWPSVVGQILLVPPFRWLAAGGYPLVARWRHRLPGGTPACRLGTGVVAHYLFNVVEVDAVKGLGLRVEAARLLRVSMWGVNRDEPHRDALAAGDLVLVYLGAPDREFIGRAELASAVHDWTPSEAQVYPGDCPRGVSLAQVEEWDPPVPMSAVLSQIDRSGNARADFETGVVRITANEFETALAVATARRSSRQV